MVLVHKLKQMEQLDIEQFRDPEIPKRVPEPPKQQVPLKRQRPQRERSPPRRPTTRSQTGRVTKRKLPDDTVETPTKPRTSHARKKPKPTPKVPAAEEPPQKETPPKEPTPPPPPPPPPPQPRSETPESSLAGDVPPLNATQLTFLESNGSSGISIEKRGPRTRAILPVPVPNLTKKSRGRRVPTKAPEVKEDNPPAEETRLYVCSVEGCGKCFHRGEHLKRHIRSIHTHEKPFQCTHSGCEKFFNRHDNLLQHLKVHRSSGQGTHTPPRQVGINPLPVLPSEQTPPPISESLAIPMHKPEKPLYQPPTSFISYTTTTPYGSSLTPLGFSTNMAVSSLRTELSPSGKKTDTPSAIHPTTPPHSISTTSSKIATASQA
ncbi:hypothetical protein BDN72DRAFT_896905 [Pluteus cervinus]|uniref:Uncharacterized protein n=1 Tax=Pluteus cervinus TaxID=181527 RepID=A0ACD3AX49_9AGAR|nr:hypothetical protein BDN72DRAFT_896905 [Pluteus cervinus]